MKFLCLAYGDAKDWNALSKEKQDELLKQDEVLRKKGTLMAAVQTKVVYRQRLGRQPKRHGRCIRGLQSAPRRLLCHRSG